MYVFSRILSPRPERAADGAAHLVQAAKHVSELTGHRVSVFRCQFGFPAGTLVASVRLASHAELGEALAKLEADPQYLELAARGAEMWSASPEDSFSRIVASTLVAEPRGIYIVVLATMTPGRFGEAMQWGGEMHEYLAEKSGRPMAFLTDSYGTFGQVRWMIGFDSIDQLDDLDDRLLQDEGYLERLASGGDLFLPGVRQVLIHRLH